jgi:hypothetical protein
MLKNIFTKLMLKLSPYPKFIEVFDNDPHNVIYIFKPNLFILTSNDYKYMLEIVLDHLNHMLFTYTKSKFITYNITIIQIDLITYKYKELTNSIFKYYPNSPMLGDQLFNLIKTNNSKIETLKINKDWCIVINLVINIKNK